MDSQISGKKTLAGSTFAAADGPDGPVAVGMSRKKRNLFFWLHCLDRIFPLGYKWAIVAQLSGERKMTWLLNFFPDFGKVTVYSTIFFLAQGVLYS